MYIRIIHYTIVLFFFFVFTSPVFAAEPVINEFLPSPDTEPNEWIEFYNPDNIDMTMYWIDDDTDFNSDNGTTDKKSLSTINTTNPVYPYFDTNSFLNNSGDFVVLFSETGTILSQYPYTENPGSDISIGRSPDGNGDFIALSTKTKGSANPTQPTPTPTPTITPMPAPSNTPAPTSTRTPTPAPTSPPTSTPKPLTATSKPTTKPTTAVLAAANKKPSPTTASPSAMPTETSEKKEVGSTIVAKFFIGLGLILLTFCGILGFRIYKERKLNIPL